MKIRIWQGAHGLVLVACLALAPACSSPPAVSADHHVRALGSTAIWKLVPGHPGSFVPAALSSRTALTPQTGEWISDERKGLRFFVPHQGVKGYSAVLLRGEAAKALAYDPHAARRKARRRNLALMPFFFLSLGAIRPWEGETGAWSASSGGSVNDHDSMWETNDWTSSPATPPAQTGGQVHQAGPREVISQTPPVTEAPQAPANTAAELPRETREEPPAPVSEPTREDPPAAPTPPPAPTPSPAGQ